MARSGMASLACSMACGVRRGVECAPRPREACPGLGPRRAVLAARGRPEAGVTAGARALSPVDPARQVAHQLAHTICSHQVVLRWALSPRALSCRGRSHRARFAATEGLLLRHGSSDSIDRSARRMQACRRGKPCQSKPSRTYAVPPSAGPAGTVCTNARHVRRVYT
jgi:hypothetical protein